MESNESITNAVDANALILKQKRNTALWTVCKSGYSDADAQSRMAKLQS